MKRRSFLKTTTIALIATMSSAILVACGSSSDSASGEDSSNEAIVVYSNSVSDGRGEWLQERASAEGFELQFVDLGGGDIQNRLIAEQANPIADVTFGMNNVYFETSKDSGVLADYTPSWNSEVDASLGDGMQFWPIVREPIMLVYNDAAYSESDAPNDWTDLWEEDKFHGRYETPTSMGGATTQLVLAGILNRYLDDSGELGVSEEGWNAIEQYFENGSPSVQGTDLFARIASGEVDMGQMWLAGKASREKEYGISTTAVHPSVGVPMATQHVALIKGAEENQAAKDFIDWFGSAETQAAWSQEFFTAPVNEAALANANQDAVEATNAFKGQEVDWETVAQYLPEWIEKIELEYL